MKSFGFRFLLPGFLCLSFILSMSSYVFGQTERIKWVSFEEALELNKKTKKKILVDIYTDWCGWCKKMDAHTFSDATISKLVNEDFIAVKFNAEYNQDITFKGKSYKFVQNGRRGYHEIAAVITQGRLSYPTFVFLDENFETIQAIPGFREVPEFAKFLSFYGDNHYKKTPYKLYEENYKPVRY